MTISRKIITGFGLIILIMVLANGYVLHELHSVSETGRAALTSDVQAIDRSKQLRGILFDEERNGRKFLVSGDEAYALLFNDDLRRFSISLDSLATLVHRAEESDAIINIGTAHESLLDAFSEGKVLSALQRQVLGAKLESAQSLIHLNLDNLVMLKQRSIDRSMAGIEQRTSRSSRVAFLMQVSALILAIVASFLIASTITRPIKTLIRGTEEIAKGSFQPVTVRSSDEMAQLARAVNEMSAKLKALEDLRTEMMQQIAHELRTPLTTMLTAHYILSQQRVGPLTPEQLRLLNSMRHNIDKLTEFSYDFLDLAKIEAGMMQYNLESTDLVQFVEPLVEEARLNASEKAISIELSVNPSPEVLIDRKRFSHVVTNLLSNAVKYTGREGKINVTISASDTGARILVRDTGIGISTEDLPKVFEKFYRVGSSEGKGARGTGVGLALVKAVTEDLGGKIVAASEVGVGSTFTLDLPAASQRDIIQQSLRKNSVGHG